jgi:hypothetical protein
MTWHANGVEPEAPPYLPQTATHRTPARAFAQ